MSAAHDAPEGAPDLPRWRCFACGRLIRRADPLQADTRDAQIVFVGRECFKLIEAAGERGYQPPAGGPRLYPLKG